ncbi:hypothetical protein FJT64_017852 [Amphibalanus amphitrite]|uniref:C2 tensin-type domain-containing protein n=1 Tax=Amphibalanus amphitrite TaxID=1232801 RepID=A0A6A4WVX2_AMPAM|nr:hypothetical protein FJT64_017852 [Amphibalanus amphitrite]
MRAVQLYKVDKWPSFLEAELVERTTDGEEYTVACTASTGREENQPAQLTFAQERGVHVTGDVLLVIWGRSRSFMPRERLCHVWFNTWFLADVPRDASGQGTIKWFKKGLDRACRDADLPDLACVQLTFLGPEAGALGQPSRE